MNRGNKKDRIFFEPEDYNKFLELLDQVQGMYTFELISYCLMTNHFHLQIRTVEDKLSVIMHVFSLRYAKYFNKKYDLVGHVFQGRYQAELIEDDAYLLQTSKYIHLNPVEAKLVENPLDYKWSSYDVYMGKREYDLVSEDKILENFYGNDKNSYKKFVEGKPSKNSKNNMPDISDMIKNFEEAAETVHI